MSPGRPARREFECKRHGVQALLAGLLVHSGEVIGEVYDRNTRVAGEFLRIGRRPTDLPDPGPWRPPFATHLPVEATVSRRLPVSLSVLVDGGRSRLEDFRHITSARPATARGRWPRDHAMQQAAVIQHVMVWPGRRRNGGIQ